MPGVEAVWKGVLSSNEEDSERTSTWVLVRGRKTFEREDIFDCIIFLTLWKTKSNLVVNVTGICSDN